MRKILKNSFSSLMVLAMILPAWILNTAPVFAANAGDVVINEIAWAGSSDNSNDEWIELYNRSNQNLDLTGWVIEDDGTPSYKLAGNIAAHGYFLIEDSENVVNNVTADQIINLSLANAGDSLVLKDAAGGVIDKVNGGGGAWYAGDGTSKATMEKMDPDINDDKAENWATAKVGNGAKSSGESPIVGTPRTVNSNYAGSGPEVRFDSAEINVNGSGTVTVGVFVDTATDLYAYGFEIDYPANLLSFQSAQEAAFLKADGTSTAFNAALKNSKEGSLIVGGARLLNPAKGVDGSGKLFDLTFKIITTNSDSGDLSFNGASFISNSEGSVAAKFVPAEIKISNDAGGGVVQVSNLKIDAGTERYALKLTWQEDPNGATSYIVKKKMVDGTFSKIGEVSTATFTDNGKLVPGITYLYQVIPVTNNVQGKAVEISGKEIRGLVGDNDRSDDVDGKDIENLARSYGSGHGDEEYNALVDTNFDGVIDGKDLIDIGVNFGLSY